MVDGTAEDGVPAQRLERLAGHVRREAGDPPGLDPRPFRVRTGQAQDGTVDAEPVDRAEDLHLLAAHDVRHAAGITGRQAGGEEHPPAARQVRSEEHKSELKSLMRSSYDVF